MAACTSCSATSMFRSRTNCSVMTELPPELFEVICFKPGELPELPLQRGRDGGGHDVRARARIERHDLDRRVVHLRQGRDGKLLETDRSRDQEARHQQRRRDRPQDEGAGRAHGPAFLCWRASPFPLSGARPAAEAAPAVASATFIPGCSLSTPSVTTVSPGAIPFRIAVSSPWVSCDFDVAHVYGRVGLDDVDEGGLRASLERGRRDDHRSAQGVHEQARVDELVREERQVLVGEDGLDLDGPGGLVDLIVQRQERARRELVLVVAVIGVHGELLAGFRSAAAPAGGGPRGW